MARRAVHFGILIILALMLCGSYAVAQQTRTQTQEGGGTDAAKDHPKMEHRVDKMFEMMDTNHDGKISKDEWMAVQEKRFARMDANSDGSLTPDEVKANSKKRKERFRKNSPKD